MRVRIKAALRILLLFALAFILLWLSLRNLEVGEGETKLGFIVSVWKSADMALLIISALLALLSHYFRAARWKLLMHPLGFPLSSSHSFYSVMIGYFVNLAIPRGGEISRCYNLYKLNGTPMDQSFGTVVAERIIDLIFLLSLIAMAFLVEIDQLTWFFNEIDLESEDSGSRLTSLGIYALVFVLLIVAAAMLTRKIFAYRYRRLMVRLRSAYQGLRKGLLIVFKLEKKGLFIFYSFGIWVMYYLMSYSIILAFPETEHLTLLDSLTIFVIGGIAMALPLPGGAGSYHVLVPLGLVLLYGIQREEAIAFSFIFHGWQTLLIIILGLLSLFGSQWYIRRIKNG